MKADTSEALVRKLEIELKDLKEEMDNLWAAGIHSCGPQCKRPACLARKQRDSALAIADKLESLLRYHLQHREQSQRFLEDEEGYSEEKQAIIALAHLKSVIK